MKAFINKRFLLLFLKIHLANPYPARVCGLIKKYLRKNRVYLLQFLANAIINGFFGKSDSSTSGPGTVMESRVEQQLLAQYPQGLHTK
ncbi:hypothetical protein [Comamonas jiangduensis]|uniref:hypothetical protein n=1 Tax=Comamonas jiangduensis TaxID=1194168 RepID=UPI001581D5DC|nr:hypothetical protein [Comamonas jiangduensis]